MSAEEIPTMVWGDAVWLEEKQAWLTANFRFRDWPWDGSIPYQISVRTRDGDKLTFTKSEEEADSVSYIGEHDKRICIIVGIVADLKTVKRR